MSVVQLNSTRCRVFEEYDVDLDDRQLVHAKDPDYPDWTCCGRFDDEPRTCCYWHGKWDGNTICVRCNKRICPACLEIGLAWYALGRWQ